MRHHSLTRHRHSTDTVSLIFGLVFVAIAGWGLFGRYIVNVNVPNLGWLVAGALILMGLLGVVASLRGDKTPADATATRDEAGMSPAGSTAPDDQPVTNEPLTDEPVTNEPLTDEPVTNEPLTDDEPMNSTSNHTDVTR